MREWTWVRSGDFGQAMILVDGEYGAETTEDDEMAQFIVDALNAAEKAEPYDPLIGRNGEHRCPCGNVHQYLSRSKD